MSRGLRWPGFSRPLVVKPTFSVFHGADSVIRLTCTPLDMVNPSSGLKKSNLELRALRSPARNRLPRPRREMATADQGVLGGDTRTTGMQELPAHDGVFRRLPNLPTGRRPTIAPPQTDAYKRCKEPIDNTVRPYYACFVSLSAQWPAPS